MPLPACRLLDLVGPGVITGPGAPTVTINGIPASLMGDIVATHGEPPHVAVPIVVGAPTVFVMGIPPTAVGVSAAACGHMASIGSPTVTYL